MTFKIIINCGPCERFIGKCLHSVISQSEKEWEAYVTVDACGDETFAKAVEAAAGDPRIRIMRNEVRRYSLYNQIAAIERAEAQPEDVIVHLDGDDWFARTDALEIIRNTYEHFDCWMTYGSWFSDPGALTPGMWPPYPEGTTDFRHHRWLGTAVRTWKQWLWEHLDQSALRDDAGKYFRIAEDRAIMIPLLEMCGTTRAKHIAAPIMVYNQAAAAPDAETVAEAERNVRIVESRPPYKCLSSKITFVG